MYCRRGSTEKTAQNKKSCCIFLKNVYNNICDCWKDIFGRQRTAQAGIAQSVEHFTRNEGVVSSSLISGLYENAVISRNLGDFESYGFFI